MQTVGCHSNSVREGEPSGEALSRRAILSYGTGHFLNDLTASCWFTYLLVFLTDIGLSPSQAASVMLSGQFADGAATILIGQLIDMFGHFKLWHAGGSLLVGLSFSSVFGGCISCRIFKAGSLASDTVTYCTFAAIFNVGWAATQVSHMSLVNCITTNSTSRVSLTSCRNAFTMIANLMLFAIAFGVFTAIPANEVEAVKYQYQWIAGLCVGAGSCFVMIFLSGTKEPRLYHHTQPTKSLRESFYSWFCKVLYYEVALVYMLMRLVTNVSQALLAFYLVDELNMVDSSKALVPAVIFISSFLTSVVLQELQWSGRRLKVGFTGGAAVWIICGVVLLVLPSSRQSFMYLLAVFLGIANALMLVTATSMEGVLVGSNLSGCAFVYGSLSLLEKLSCGLALYAIEAFHVKKQVCIYPGTLGDCNITLVRKVFALVPATCAFLGACITMMMDLDETQRNAHPLHEPLLLCVDGSQIQTDILDAVEEASVGAACEHLHESECIIDVSSRALGSSLCSKPSDAARLLKK